MGIALAQVFLAQGDQAWTLLPGLLLFFYALAVLYPTFDVSKKKEELSLSLRWELFLLSLILLAAFFFRIYDIGSLPAGMHSDQGLTGLCALRILHEGWRPFGEVFDYQVPELLLFYQLAAWFGLVGSSYFTFHLFFILLSLASFPFVYWAVRQWAGRRTALLSLFILAVMRWNWIETRNGYPSIQVPFYLFGALAFWAYWRSSGKKWSLWVSALFIGTGFYTYQAFKIVPLLMVIYAFYESRPRGERAGVRVTSKSSTPLTIFRPYLSYFLIILVLIAPLLTVMAQRGILGHRESDLFLGTRILQEHSLQPLWDVWTGTVLMFNRSGDPNPRHNIPGHRMLDDVTAVFFLLGLALAWRRRKEAAGFYPLAGFGVMLLTGLLSTDPAHSNRLVSLTPFVAYFAGSAFLYLYDKARTTFPQPEIHLSAILLLAAMVGLNTQTYFGDQARNQACQEAFAPAASFIGRNIEVSWKDFPGLNRYFITPSLFHHHTVDFLAYTARPNLYPFNLRDWVSGKIPRDKAIHLYLEPEQSGELEFVRALCPDSALVSYPSIFGSPEMGYCWIPKEEKHSSKPWEGGLKGVYISSSAWNAKPLAVQRDPVLNFTSKFDFPFTQPPPFRIRWRGSLEIPKSGDYQFQVITTDETQLWLDGKPVSWAKPLRLSPGAHALRLDFEKDSGDTLALNLIWKKPGEDKWQVVPATAFGKIKPNAEF